MSNEPICPCETFVHPKAIFNPPGRSIIAYRAGDYTTFRHALLLSLTDEKEQSKETELTNWRPSAKGDLALQMMEWWAYLADILTFYNERIANQDYLRTADLPESVQRLIRLLGYRPRPGIGATGSLAVLLARPAPITLQKGFQIQSKPGPGQQPQVFELNADTTIDPPEVIVAEPKPEPSLVQPVGENSGVLISGTVSTIKLGDQLLVMESGWNGSNANWALGTVVQSGPEKAPDGTTNTRVVLKGSLGLSGAVASNYQLLKSTQSAHPWQYGANNVISDNLVDLESVTRTIKAGDVILFEATRTFSVLSKPPSPQLASVITYTEVVWYANAPDPNNPQIPPNQQQQVQYGPPIPVPHSELKFRGTPGAGPIGSFNGWAKSTLIRFGWQPVGQLIPTPATALSTNTPELVPTSPTTFPSRPAAPVLIEDVRGAGESATAVVTAPPRAIQLSALPDRIVPLTPPFNVLYGLIQVSRGKTVANEVLGSGNAAVAGQEFVLQKSPLTYLLSAESTSGANYKSALRVWVNGVEWKEVPSFYGQQPDAHIFVTREDEQHQTYVQFGDGVNGSRLPSGANNVMATYRYGSGADAPDAGSLTVIIQPRPGLKAIRNPVPVGGGADPDPPQYIKKYAPQSVLTFGRAVSGDDYETIAAQAPGVARAKAYWTWDAVQQRALVTIYVGDDVNAVTAAQAALSGVADPNRPVAVRQATAVTVFLTLTLVVDPNYTKVNVVAAATAALMDPDNGLFGIRAIGIGQLIYDSQIYQACLNVPGMVAVHNLTVARITNGLQAPFLERPFRLDPGQGGFLQLLSTNLTISSEVAAHAR